MVYYMVSLLYGWWFITVSNAVAFPDPEPPAINVLYVWLGTRDQCALSFSLFSFVTSSKLIIIFNFSFLHFYQISFAHLSSTCAIWIRYYCTKRLQSLVITSTQCDLVNLFCEYIACFYPKALLRFHYFLIILQNVFAVSEFHIAFYCALCCGLWHIFKIAIIYQITISLRSQRHKLFHYFSIQYVS